MIKTDIKGLAMNKARARVWYEAPERVLSAYGFVKGGRVNIGLLSDAIVITAAEDGKRKVSGKVKASGTQCIFDVCMPVAQREAMFGGAQRLDVEVTHGRIMIFVNNS